MTLNVVIKSEPRSFAKGQFQCEIGANGLTLTQKKQEIKISIGVDAQYAGQNQINVALSDCRLEIHVTKFGTYQNRLAKDIAAFLAGSGHSPSVNNYSLSWYFYVVSVLPIGIPIVTLGGAIPAAIGVGLAGACFVISQKENWSIPVRLLAAGTLVALGYIALFSVMALAFGSSMQ